MPTFYCNSISIGICSVIIFSLDIYVSASKVSLSRPDIVLHLSHLYSNFHFLYTDFGQVEHFGFPEHLIHSSSSLL
jgi:hypothetical protein